MVSAVLRTAAPPEKVDAARCTPEPPGRIATAPWASAVLRTAAPSEVDVQLYAQDEVVFPLRRDDPRSLDWGVLTLEITADVSC